MQCRLQTLGLPLRVLHVLHVQHLAVENPVKPRRAKTDFLTTLPLCPISLILRSRSSDSGVFSLRRALWSSFRSSSAFSGSCLGLSFSGRMPFSARSFSARKSWSRFPDGSFLASLSFENPLPANQPDPYVFVELRPQLVEPLRPRVDVGLLVDLAQLADGHLLLQLLVDLHLPKEQVLLLDLPAFLKPAQKAVNRGSRGLIDKLFCISPSNNVFFLSS